MPAEAPKRTLSERLCVISAARDVVGHVSDYRKMVEAFVPRPTRVVICENDSSDGTREALQKWRSDYVKVIHVQTGMPLLPREATARRAAHLAYVRNVAIEEALQWTDWDVALMQDVQKYASPDLPAALIADGGDIVAPMIWADPERRWFYDVWCFRDCSGRSFDSRHPLESSRGERRVAVNAVGGVYLVRRQVFETGCRLAGTDGTECDSVPFCMAAKTKGFGVWVRQDLSAFSCITQADWDTAPRTQMSCTVIRYAASGEAKRKAKRPSRIAATCAQEDRAQRRRQAKRRREDVIV